MSSNSQGIKNTIVDDLIEKVIAAETREDKLAACRALDRVLLWNYYSINLYFGNKEMLAYWDRFGAAGNPTQVGAFFTSGHLVG